MRWIRDRAALLATFGLLLEACATTSFPPPCPGDDEARLEELRELDLSEGRFMVDPAFPLPYHTGPEFLNRERAQQAIEEAYPPVLRDGGIGGTVFAWLLVTAEGEVAERRVVASSGYEALDRAALRVADVFRFRPATWEGCSTHAWVQFPISFRVLD